jgi:RNA polymerase sigma-54 factor
MKLTLRQTQRVVMTPLLQQAIQLLQLSTLELEQVVRKELEENPLLEEVPVEVEGPSTPAPEVSAAATPGTDEPVSKETATVDAERAEELPFDLSTAMFDEPDERTPVSMEERDDLPFENLAGNDAPSLTDHLMEQLRLSTADETTLRIGEAIIGNLDEDGYLRADLAEIAEGTGSPLEVVEATLRRVQGFDPRGVAARSIQECLLLQISADPEPDPVTVEILEQYFDDLGRRRYAEIARAMKLPVDRIMESVEEIQALEPRPGRRFGGADSRYIVPDVTIQKVGSDYMVLLNEEGIPRLRVNALYRSLLKRTGDEAKQYVEQKIRSALWLIKSVEQRQRTLRRVAQSLVNFQREFLDKGIAYLRPLALRDVGDDINMHESTISRVTTNKYMQTPQGLFELKFFFHSGIASKDGAMVSSVSVKKTIRDMVEAEDAEAPLSDQEIAQQLHAQGLTIARRTVAKYREELGVLPSHQRRLQAKKR